MIRNKQICPSCGKEISRSNFNRHVASCQRVSEPIQPKPKLSRHEVQMALPEQFRRERASTAAKKKREKYKELTEARVHGSVSFDELNGVEKRQRVLLEQNHSCSECGVGELWNGKPLKLELDHIDGDTKNNSRDNLRMICPNCHQQTPTYKNKNRNEERKTYTDMEIIHALIENTSGYTAMKSLGMNPHGGNYIRVRRIIKDYGVDLPYTV